ncbi:MAG: SIMPL domain-containing protein [Bacteroidales bacterium]
MDSNSANRFNFLGLSIMIGLIVLGLCIKSSVTVFKSYDRVVSVKGLAEMEVSSDKVIWPIVYKEIGDNLPVLYKTINEKNDIIIEFLKSKGIEMEEISISAPKIIDMSAERYQSQVNKYRYNVTSILTVTSKKVDKVRDIISEQSDLLQKGIAISAGDYEYQTQYLFTKLNDIKPVMIEEATKNARASAEKFAKDSESKLGKIKSANQGQFTITDRDANTPHIKVVRVVSTIDYLLKD